MSPKKYHMRLNLFCGLALLLLSLGSFAETLRIEAPELHQQLQNSDLTIALIDARGVDDYMQGHLPGAFNLAVAQTYENSEVSGRVSSPMKMQMLFRQAGLTTEQTVVVYDSGSMIDAARVFWTLEVYGFEKVRILNGGLAEWEKHNFAVENQVPEIKPSDYIVRVDNRRLASKFTTRLATINPNQTVIDARPTSAYRGETSSAKRFGHIPSAINITFHQNLQAIENHHSRLSNTNELQAVYSSIPKEQKVIIYCEAGKVSSVTYLSLRELGYDVANYDASWREWGNDMTLPIETPGN